MPGIYKESNKRILVKECSGLTLAICQMPTQLLSVPLLNWAEEENRMKKLMGWDKDREVTNCHHGQNRVDLGKINVIYCQLKESRMVRKTGKK